MKSIKHFLLAVLALATVLTVVSCKDEDDDPSEVASYANSGVKVTFYDNATFRMEGELNGNSAVLEGTYKGDADKDGDITLELTKATMAGQEAPAEYLAGFSPMIGGGEGTVSDNGKKLTLGVVTYTRS
ncbi:MAG: hypothetical protein K2M50_05000 [Treponemataceae bacterium]|nr:hypothetical protein [Treponemataceae bacterium]